MDLDPCEIVSMINTRLIIREILNWINDQDNNNDILRDELVPRFESSSFQQIGCGVVALVMMLTLMIMPNIDLNGRNRPNRLRNNNGDANNNNNDSLHSSKKYHDDDNHDNDNGPNFS